MEQTNTVVYPPNKNLQRNLDFSKIPVVYNHLQFLDINEQGESIVGSSNLSGTVWENTLLFFKNISDLLSLNSPITYVSSTASDAKFIDNQTIAIGEDTGILNIITVTSETNKIDSITYFRHSDRIAQLAVWKKNSNVLTCSGNCLSIWDVSENNPKPVQRFENYHADAINSVDTTQNQPGLFVSAATDRKCCIWDVRASSHQSVLYNNEFCSLTSVAFNQQNTNYVVVGTEAGDVYLLDQREPDQFVAVFSCFENNVHRIAFDDNNPDRFAVCGDLNETVTLKCEGESVKEVHRDEAHQGIVRGLKWSQGDLYSCGFDKCVIKHVF